RAQKQRSGIDRPGADDDDVARVDLGHAVALDVDLRDRAPGGVRLESRHQGVGRERGVRTLESRVHAQRLRVGFGLDQTGETVAGRAADAPALRAPLVQADAERNVEGLYAQLRQVVVELLDARLVRDLRETVSAARR